MPFVDSTELSTRERLPGWTSRVFQSDNSGGSWSDLNSAGLDTLQFQSIAVHPSDISTRLHGVAKRR